MDKQTLGTIAEPTNSEILEAINSFASDVQKEFTVLKTDVGTLKTDVSVLKSDVSTLKSDVSVLKTDVATLKSDVSVLKTDVSTLKTDVNRIESQMVTKSYLDEKLGNFKGDMVALIRKEDNKTDRIVEELERHQVLPPASIQSIRDLHVFPAPPAI